MTPRRPVRSIDLGHGAWVRRSDLRFSFSRAGGPGGQSVNKVSTRAELRVAVESIEGLSKAARGRLRKMAGRRLTGDDELLFAAAGSRSQLDNRRACLERLRKLVDRAAPPPKRRRPTRPPRSAVRKRLAEKRRVSEKKQSRRPPERE